MNFQVQVFRTTNTFRTGCPRGVNISWDLNFIELAGIARILCSLVLEAKACRELSEPSKLE